MRQTHTVPKTSDMQRLLAALAAIQILCARGATLEQIHDAAERAIQLLTSRH